MRATSAALSPDVSIPFAASASRSCATVIFPGVIVAPSEARSRARLGRASGDGKSRYSGARETTRVSLESGGASADADATSGSSNGARREKKKRVLKKRAGSRAAPDRKGNPKGRTKPEKLRLKFGRTTPSKGRESRYSLRRSEKTRHFFESRTVNSSRPENPIRLLYGRFLESRTPKAPFSVFRGSSVFGFSPLTH